MGFRASLHGSNPERSMSALGQKQLVKRLASEGVVKVEESIVGRGLFTEQPKFMPILLNLNLWTFVVFGSRGKRWH
jgi:hypothetical protein